MAQLNSSPSQPSCLELLFPLVQRPLMPFFFTPVDPTLIFRLPSSNRLIATVFFQQHLAATWHNQLLFPFNAEESLLYIKIHHFLTWIFHQMTPASQLCAKHRLSTFLKLACWLSQGTDLIPTKKCCAESTSCEETHQHSSAEAFL